MNITYIGIGSNLESPLTQVNHAVAAITRIGHVNARSSWYESVAIGPGEQPNYINGVICLETILDPDNLLQALQNIENAQGRVRNIRWGARTLDLDILLFNNILLDTDQLTIPHPRMLERHFVIYPLYEIAPTLLLPNKQSIAEIISGLSSQGLEKWA